MLAQQQKSMSISPLTIVSMALLFVMAAAMIVMESVNLNLSAFLDTNVIFEYANIILLALGPVVMISVGFGLGRTILNFVQSIFRSL